MKYLLIYVIGYFISAIYFAIKEFQSVQEKFPSLAVKDKKSDIQSGVVVGIMKAFFWPLLLPIEIIVNLILAH